MEPMIRDYLYFDYDKIQNEVVKQAIQTMDDFICELNSLDEPEQTEFANVNCDVLCGIHFFVDMLELDEYGNLKYENAVENMAQYIVQMI